MVDVQHYFIIVFFWTPGRCPMCEATRKTVIDQGRHTMCYIMMGTFSILVQYSLHEIP